MSAHPLHSWMGSSGRKLPGMDLEALATQLAQTIQKEANINAIFGDPKTLDDHTIIPVGRIKVTLGAGGANATGPVKPVAEGLAAALGGGAGGGGGLELEVQPLGFIRDGSDGPIWVSIDPSSESLVGKIEHLLDGLRRSIKPDR